MEQYKASGGMKVRGMQKGTKNRPGERRRVFKMETGWVSEVDEYWQEFAFTLENEVLNKFSRTKSKKGLHWTRRPACVD